METGKTRTRSPEAKKGKTTTMKTPTRRPKIRPETAVKKVFGTIGETEAQAETFERSFWDCMENANNTVEYIVLRTYEQLRGEARELSRERPFAARAMNSLADNIEEGIRAWYPLMEADMKADREHAKMISGGGRF